jgi:hypothetical protein
MTLPGGLLSIAGSAFQNSSLTSLTFSPFSTHFGVNCDFLRDISGRHLLRYLGRGDVSLENSIEKICESCFAGCGSLSLVTFAGCSRLSQIGERAFYRSELRAIHLPASVEVIGGYCFFECQLLQSVTFEIGSKLLRIESRAFCESGLTGIELPASVRKISRSCFRGCAGLTTITFAPGSKLSVRLCVYFRKT